MKVIHSFYRSSQPSGENETVLQQVDLLAKHGYDVELIYLASDDLEKSRLATAATAIGMIAGSPSAKLPRSWCEDADLLHIHNTFPRMSLRTLVDVRVPKVISLHNYRAFCANGLFLRNGQRCMDCTRHGSWQSIVHGCYHGSRLQTIPVASQQVGSGSLASFLSKCDAVVVPGEPMRDILAKLGVQKLQVLPNPINPHPPTIAANPTEAAWLFAARLTAEKGLAEVLEIWPRNVVLLVVGEGATQSACEEIIERRGLRVELLGALPNQHLRALMSQCIGFIFASKAQEGAPMVYGEALNAGLPVLAARGSTVAAQVELDRTGMTFDLDDECALTDAMATVSAHRDELAQRSRKIFAARYSPEKWAEGIGVVYQKAIRAHSNR